MRTTPDFEAYCVECARIPIYFDNPQDRDRFADDHEDRFDHTVNRRDWRHHQEET